MLPKSHIISEGVSRKGRKAFNSGGFAEVWKGELVDKNLNRISVCLKTIKVATMDGEKARKENEKVGYSPFLYASPFTQFTVVRHSMRRSPCGCD